MSGSGAGLVALGDDTMSETDVVGEFAIIYSGAEHSEGGNRKFAIARVASVHVKDGTDDKLFGALVKSMPQTARNRGGTVLYVFAWIQEVGMDYVQFREGQRAGTEVTTEKLREQLVGDCGGEKPVLVQHAVDKGTSVNNGRVRAFCCVKHEMQLKCALSHIARQHEYVGGDVSYPAVGGQCPGTQAGGVLVFPAQLQHFTSVEQ